MNSDQKRVYELLKHPMSLDVAYERSDFRNRYHFSQIVQNMVSQGILEETEKNQKKNNDVDTITVISRAKKISPAKLAAGAAAMFVWFYVVPTVVFIIGG